MSIRLARPALAALLSTTLLLAGCGGDDAADSKDDKASAEGSASTDTGDVDASAEATTDESATGSAQGSGAIEPLSKDDFYDAITAAQREAGTFRGQVTTVTNGVSTVVDAEGAYIDGKIAARAKTGGSQLGDFESILLDGILYITGDGQIAPEGKWLKFDPNDPGAANSPFAALLQLADPELALRAIGEPKEFELVGAEKIDGIETNRYRIVIDSSVYTENLNLPAEFASLLPPTLEYDMWVDADNRPVRIQQEVEVQGIKTSTEQRYFDYGADVDIKAPPAADVVSPGQTG